MHTVIIISKSKEQLEKIPVELGINIVASYNQLFLVVCIINQYKTRNKYNGILALKKKQKNKSSESRTRRIEHWRHQNNDE